MSDKFDDAWDRAMEAAKRSYIQDWRWALVGAAMWVVALVVVAATVVAVVRWLT